MAGPLANSTNRYRVTLKDPTGAGVLGVTVTLTVANSAGTIVINNVSVTSLGSGIYEYVSTAGAITTAGTYTAKWNAVDATAKVWHHEEQFVVSL